MDKFLFFLIIFIMSNISFSQTEEIDEYFYEVAYKSEFNQKIYSKKWNSDVKIYICDYKNDNKYEDSLNKTMDTLKNETIKIISELNDIVGSINFTLVEDSLLANFYIFLGSSNWYNKVVPQTIPYTKGNYGLGWVILKNNIIVRSYVFVDTYRISTIKEKKHLLREEITQSLGLFNDSWKYPTSIFYQGWTDVIEYSEIDKKIISKLYNN